MNTQPAAASEDLHDDHDNSDDHDDLHILAVDDILLRLGAVAVQHPSAIGHEELGAQAELDFTGDVV